MEVFARRTKANRSMQRQEQVNARLLQEVVCPHAVERINLAADVKEHRDVAAIPRQAGERAEIRPRTVVVKARPFGNTLARARFSFGGLLGDAKRQRVDRAEYRQPAPSQ